MKLTIQALGLTPHQPLEDYANKKLEKLDTFYDKILLCELTLKKENTTEKEDKTAEVRLHIPGDDIVVKKTCTTFEESIDQCADVAKRLIIKKKEKQG